MTTNKDIELTAENRAVFCGIVGQLNWVSNTSRPDMSFSACELSTLQSKPTNYDLSKANKSLKEMKQENVLIKYRPLKVDKLKIKVFADASYGNLKDGGSQGGSIIFLSDENNEAPISWSSHRLKRVAKSILCAETLFVVKALDNAYLYDIKGCCRNIW